MRKEFEMLRTIPGIGNILGLTIMLEVGDIARFPKSGRLLFLLAVVWKVNAFPTARKKEKTTRKMATNILAWAYVEAAQFCQKILCQSAKLLSEQRSENETCRGGQGI